MPRDRTEKNVFKIVLASIGLLGSIGLLNGCTEVVVPGAMAGGGEYYRYTTSNIAKETLMGKSVRLQQLPEERWRKWTCVCIQ
ncbi:MAG: hypothetical protein PVG59_17745 [Desulfobacterales bacterium]|jgi:hypothetical protein